MSVLILTGPSGAGKNTIAAAYARLRERCAVIDVDLLRWMVLQPHVAPWNGEAGIAQQQRNISRGPRLQPHEIRMLYEWQTNLSRFDHKIDNSELSPEQVAAQLLAWMEGQ